MVYLIGTALWIIFMVAASTTARARGRSANGWALLGFLIGPLAWMLVSVLPALPDFEAQQQEWATMRTCPHCLSRIPKAASVCRYCQRDVKPFIQSYMPQQQTQSTIPSAEPMYPGHAVDCQCMSCQVQRKRLAREAELGFRR